MATNIKYNKARNQLILAGLILAALVIGWFVLLYNPISTDIQVLNAAIKSEEDSLIALERYKSQDEDLRLSNEVDERDDSIPPRKQLVSITKQLNSYFASYDFELIEMQPSLNELNSIERAGINVAGKYISKQLLKVTLHGRYFSLGRMLERIDQLPFRVTVTNVAMNSIPNNRPELEIKLDMFLYVRE